MTYDEAIAFWYGRINYEVRAASPSDLKLERMRALLRRLGDPHRRLRCVHVAGTKGKGSTCALLEAVCRAAGYRVGLFTSPHLVRVEERLQVDRVPVSADELAALMGQVAPAVRAMDALGEAAAPTFFEIITALGFLHFVQRRVELAILEVGLGGRFDSTNVCYPLATAVTSIGHDHMAQLGETLEEIAFQKAGVVKPGVPVVCGPLAPGPMEVVRAVAATFRAPLTQPGGPPAELAVGLIGAHQRANAAVALGLADCLARAGFTLPESARRRGLSAVEWPARVELLPATVDRPRVVLDSAHNVPSAEALVAALEALTPRPREKVLVFAASSDKQYAEMLAVLAPHFDRVILTTYAANQRAVPPERLLAAVMGPSAEVVTPAAAAWRRALGVAGPDDLVAVAGSIFLAGELRPLIVG